MSEETYTLILQVIEKQSEANAAQTKAVQQNLDVGFSLLANEFKSLSAEMAKITEQKKIQNGRVDKLECVTRINRFVVDNPKWSTIMGIIGYFGVIEISKFIAISDIIKKYLP